MFASHNFGIASIADNLNAISGINAAVEAMRKTIDFTGLSTGIADLQAWSDIGASLNSKLVEQITSAIDYSGLAQMNEAILKNLGLLDFERRCAID